MKKYKTNKNLLKILLPTLVIFLLTLSLPNHANSDKFFRNNKAQPCGKLENPIVKVQQRIVNMADSGEQGNYWAFDNSERIIRLYEKTNTGYYCADLPYVGKFDAVNGQISPGGTGILQGDEDGHFDGGYRATIKGNLRTVPLWTTAGNIGTTNYLCDLNGNCPGAVNWVDQYFEEGYEFIYSNWEWVYKGGENRGRWVNSSEGNSGDVL